MKKETKDKGNTIALFSKQQIIGDTKVVYVETRAIGVKLINRAQIEGSYIKFTNICYTKDTSRCYQRNIDTSFQSK